jgi:hypothetical protein
MQLYVMNEICKRQNKAMMALVKLQSCGITEDQIFNLCSLFEDHSIALNTSYEKEV